VTTAPFEELRVLLVEDTVNDALLIERELRRAGLVFAARRVESRQALRAELERFRPHLILSDDRLPGLDGLAVVRLAQERAPGTPLILVTGSPNEEVAAGCLRAGAVDYIPKDDLARLGAAVRSALQHRP
jgi:CheY-like chemotaxis protein